MPPSKRKICGRLNHQAGLVRDIEAAFIQFSTVRELFESGVACTKCRKKPKIKVKRQSNRLVAHLQCNCINIIPPKVKVIQQNFNSFLKKNIWTILY